MLSETVQSNGGAPLRAAHAKREGEGERTRHADHHARHEAQRLVRARGRQQDRPRREPFVRRTRRRRRAPRRHEDDQRSLRRRDDARARSALDPDRGGPHRRRAAVREARARVSSPRTSTRKSGTRGSTPSRSRSRAAHKLGLVNARLLEFVDAQRAQAERRDRRRSRSGVRVLRPANGLRPVPPQAPEDAPRRSRRRSSSSSASRAPSPRPCTEALELYGLFSSARVPAELADALQRGHEARAALELLLARLARRSPREHLPAVHRHRAALEVLGRHRARVPPRPLARLAHREHERALERHRPLAEDARRLGVRREPGRQAQGRVLRLSRALARRRRGVPRAPRQHRRRGQRAPTT